MNNIAQTGEWPEQYKTEWGVPLWKTKPAADESKTRLILCTNKMNIVLETQVIIWLRQIVGHKLDSDQFFKQKSKSTLFDRDDQFYTLQPGFQGPTSNTCSLP